MTDLPDPAPLELETALAEANPRALGILFAEDPLKLTRSDLGSMVTYLRAERHRFKQVEDAAKAEGKKTPRGSKKTHATPAASLDTLDLEL